jgi:hypothetical protein
MGRVGMRIECGCPPLAFGRTLPLSLEIGLGEAEIRALG